MTRRLRNRTRRKKVIIIVAAVFLVLGIVVAVVIMNIINVQNQQNLQNQSAESNASREDGTKDDGIKKNDEYTKNEEGSDEQQNENDQNAGQYEQIAGGNCTTQYGPLTLINANFTVDDNYIWTRKAQLVNVTDLYGIREANSYNGAPLVDPEAAKYLNQMIKDYEASHQGHTMQTMSCFRARGTSCGRLCAATGTSEHHTGYACDLIDVSYGSSLDTDDYNRHIEWQWLKDNSYKYGFIDRYPAEWAGGSMAQPINVDENGSTGYYETWHYRYVGLKPAMEIATGKYNNGKYDSLEHYLKQTGRIKTLTSGKCD